MIVNVIQREKVRVDTIPVSNCFHIVDSDRYCMRISLADAKVFDTVLSEDAVYGVNLLTGGVDVFESTMVVEQIVLKVEEG